MAKPIKFRLINPPNKKRFGSAGVYNFHSGWTTKAEARKEAARQRLNGFKTRVVKTREGFMVYRR